MQQEINLPIKCVCLDVQAPICDSLFLLNLYLHTLFFILPYAQNATQYRDILLGINATAMMTLALQKHFK